MREAEKRLATTQEAVGEARENYYITMEKYRAGQGILLDVIDAQVALSTAETNFATAQYDYARYKAQVENTAGIAPGISAEAVDPKAAEKARRNETEEKAAREAADSAGSVAATENEGSL